MPHNDSASLLKIRSLLSGIRKYGVWGIKIINQLRNYLILRLKLLTVIYHVMTLLKELMFFTTGTRLDYNRNTHTLAMQTITEPSGCAVNNLNIFEIKSHQTNSDISKEDIWACAL